MVQQIATTRHHRARRRTRGCHRARRRQPATSRSSAVPRATARVSTSVRRQHCARPRAFDLRAPTAPRADRRQRVRCRG